MLELENLHAGYGPTKVLHGVSLKVVDGRVLGVCGPNGAGKSTLLRVIAGQIPVDHGDIRWDGNSLIGTKAPRIVRSGIALCPEGRRVFPRMTTRENLLIGAYTRKDRARVDKDVDDYLSLWPVISRRIDSPAGLLSGGEQQIVAIGRALLSAPRLLLLDEPSLGLAPVLIDQVYTGLKQLVADRDMSVLLVEQNVVKALELCSEVSVLGEGRITFIREVTETTADEVGSHYFEGSGHV